MKKILKAPLAIVIVIGIIYILGQHTPFAVNRLKKEIRPGLSVEQVMDILNNAGKKPYLCCWQVQGSKDPICSNPKSCELPNDWIKKIGASQKLKLSVVFLRQGFLHTDFYVLLDSYGLVVSVSEDKRLFTPGRNTDQ